MFGHYKAVKIGQAKSKHLGKLLGRLGGVCVTSENVQNFSYFEIAPYSPLVYGFIVLRFLRGGFVCYVNSGAYAPKIHFGQKLPNCVGVTPSDAI